MMRIALLSYLATYGNAPLLARALKELGHDVRMILRYRNAAGQGDFGFADEFPNWQIEDPDQCKIASEWIKDCDRFVIVALPSYVWVLARLCKDHQAMARRKGGAFIASSSHLFYGMVEHRERIAASGLSPVEWNCNLLQQSWLRIFAQPHKRCYLQSLKPRPYYQPIEFLGDNLAGDGPIRIGHAPGRKRRYHWKGTEEIKEVFARLSKEYGNRIHCEALPETPFRDLLERRRNYHIYIDQICSPHKIEGYPDYVGGLDKAGLEAMAAGCAVITSGGPLSDGKVFARPPCVSASAESLYGELKDLIENPDRIGQLSVAGRKWVREYCNPEAVVGRILKKIQ